MTDDVKLPFVWIVEEVPGVPADEAFYIRHDGETYHFPNHPAAVTWCKGLGLNYQTEWFQP